MTIREEIEQLKKEKNAVILAHYFSYCVRFRPGGQHHPNA